MTPVNRDGWMHNPKEVRKTNVISSSHTVPQSSFCDDLIFSGCWDFAGKIFYFPVYRDFYAGQNGSGRDITKIWVMSIISLILQMVGILVLIFDSYHQAWTIILKNRMMRLKKNPPCIRYRKFLQLFGTEDFIGYLSLDRKISFRCPFH
jgi:hypothetical protein